jgi:hypothetical protein
MVKEKKDIYELEVILFEHPNFYHFRDNKKYKVKWTLTQKSKQIKNY